MSYASILRAYKARQRKTFSQKVARFFEVVDYFLLVPATAGLCCTLFIPPLFFIILPTYSFGCLLLIGYIKHSRGKLDEHNVWGLWLGTALYNAIGLIVIRWFVLYDWFDREFQRNWANIEFWMRPDTLIFIGWLSWFVLICSLSVLLLFRDWVELQQLKSIYNVL